MGTGGCLKSFCGLEACNFVTYNIVIENYEFYSRKKGDRFRVILSKLFYISLKKCNKMT
jgi:hypothetical protein